MNSGTVEKDAPSVSTPAIVDVDTEFAYHLTTASGFDYILRSGMGDSLLLNPKVKGIFRFAQHHYETTGHPATLKVFQTEFPHFSFQTPETQVQWVVEKLRERYQKNELEDVVLRVAEMQSRPAEAMEYLRDRVRIIESEALTQNNILTKGDHKLFLTDLQNDIIEGMYQGASFGYLEIDRFTGGNKPGGVGYLLARPKRQKTFNWLQAFIENIKLNNAPYLHTNELTKKEIMARMSCMISGFSWDKMQRGELMSADYAMIDQAWEQFNEMYGDYWIEQPEYDSRTVADIFLRADHLGAKSVFVSQFKYIEPHKEYRNEFDKYASIAMDLKRYATRPGSERPVYIEAQYNRGADSMSELEDFDPSKVGLTDMIAQSADILLGIFQNKDLRDSQQLELGILESRNTDKAAWYVHYEYKTHTELGLVSGSQH